MPTCRNALRFHESFSQGFPRVFQAFPTSFPGVSQQFFKKACKQASKQERPMAGDRWSRVESSNHTTPTKAHLPASPPYQGGPHPSARDQICSRLQGSPQRTGIRGCHGSVIWPFVPKIRDRPEVRAARSAARPYGGGKL